MQQADVRGPGDLRQLREAERAGQPFLVYRDESGEQQIAALGARLRLVLGRRDDCDLVLGWDSLISRTHARLERVGRDWTVVDDGLSSNGTYVNEQRVLTRRRLHGGDLIRVGRTVIVFHDPSPGGERTEADAEAGRIPAIPPAQRRVLLALCRPALEARALVPPPTNEQIAAELFLSVQAVKSHLRLLFGHFDIGDLPQNQKRLRLVERALEGGLTPD